MMAPWWQLVLAGFVGAITRDAIRLVLNSEWLAWAIIRADFRAIGRAQRRK